MTEVEHCIKTITIDENLPDEVKKLEAEGWNAVPGVLPVAVYHLVRSKRPQAPAQQGGFGQIRVDDSKVFTLRDGKLVQ